MIDKHYLELLRASIHDEDEIIVIRARDARKLIRHSDDAKDFERLKSHPSPMIRLGVFLGAADSNNYEQVLALKEVKDQTESLLEEIEDWLNDFDE